MALQLALLRGFSLTGAASTGQAGFDLTWGKFYAGLWASGLNFGDDQIHLLTAHNCRDLSERLDLGFSRLSWLLLKRLERWH